ncbi:MAG: OmpA family protein [Bacteroidota bacterium]
MKLIKHTYRLFLLVALMGGSQAIAQSTGAAKKYFRLAEKEYAAQQYLYAIPLYKAVLKEGGKDTATLHKLADSYWQVRNIDSALRYYQQYEETTGGAMQSSAMWRYAELLAQNSDYDHAVKLLGKMRDGNNKLVQARKEGFMYPAKFIKENPAYHVQYLNINSPQSDYSAQYYGQGLVYLSGRITTDRSTRSIGWNGNTYSRLYQVKDTSLLTGKDTTGKWQLPSYMEELAFNDDDTRPTSNDNPTLPKEPGIALRANMTGLYPAQPFANGLHIDFNNGPVCFNKEGNTIYFTRNSRNKKEGLYHLEICSAVLQNGEWSEVKTFAFVKEGYDYFHPTLSADGSRLYFCSNQPGGAGGTDIYSIAVTAADGAPPGAINESTINTEGNELFPTFHGDTLYFSSDGYAGLGGLDIYRTNKNNQPENLGAPFNSSYDDFGIVYAANGTEGLFTSNRLGSDDLYSFRTNLPHMNLSTIDSLNHIAQLKRNATEARNTGEDARRRQEELAHLKEVLTDYVRTTQPDMDLLFTSVLFEPAKDILLPEAKKALADTKIFMDMHPGYLLMIEGHTDIRAEETYNMDLSIRRAASVRSYLMSIGIPGDKMISKGYGLTRPVAPNGTLYGRQLNRRVEIKIVKQ